MVKDNKQEAKKNPNRINIMKWGRNPRYLIVKLLIEKILKKTRRGKSIHRGTKINNSSRHFSSQRTVDVIFKSFETKHP